jgi:hypothetical protein
MGERGFKHNIEHGTEHKSKLTATVKVYTFYQPRGNSNRELKNTKLLSSSYREEI